MTLKTMNATGRRADRATARMERCRMAQVDIMFALVLGLTLSVLLRAMLG